MSDELKPCPFCGSDVIAGGRVMPTMKHAEDCYLVTHAREAWNRRATPTPAPGPSRLEIAAKLLAGMLANPACPSFDAMVMKSLELADALIAEAGKDGAKWKH
jgi:hypothetical protein